MNSKVLIAVMVPMAAIITLILTLWLLQQRRNYHREQANDALAYKQGRASSIIDKEKAEHVWPSEVERSEKKVAFGGSETQYYEMDGGYTRSMQLTGNSKGTLKVVVPAGSKGKNLELEGSPSTGELEGDAIRHSIVEVVLTADADRKVEGGFF